MLRCCLLYYHAGVGNTGPPLQEGSKTDLAREFIQEKRRDSFTGREEAVKEPSTGEGRGGDREDGVQESRREADSLRKLNGREKGAERWHREHSYVSLSP